MTILQIQQKLDNMEKRLERIEKKFDKLSGLKSKKIMF